ncbi:MAG: ATP-dependent DNA helicase RecQ [Blastocatellia bacterium]|nr:ATP-dependent DNA helicase RecQ [Blastocatellia bacterium]
MTDLSNALSALERVFGFSEFREGQDDVIRAVLEGENALVVMPTGGGKSLCYQLPAIVREGTTLVVSPLIALMKDQTDALAARGVAATIINSTVTPGDVARRIRAMRSGAYKLVYVAPERFRSERFVEAAAEADISLVAVDEAHCISEWGHDFRPDYRLLGASLQRIGCPQILALTATATAEVRADIARQLVLGEARHFIAGFDRPNLALRVVPTAGERDKLREAVATIRASGGSGIVYAATRKAVEDTARQLTATGLRAAPYHAGLSDRARAEAQDAFMSGDLDVIVATNAFGMGIDKPDIRFVIHWHIPGSIEAYYQEIGRAGRDGLPSTCTLLFNYADTRFQQFFIDGSFPGPDVVAAVYAAVVGLSAAGREPTSSAIAGRVSLKNDMSLGSALAMLERAGHIERMAGNDPGDRFGKTVRLLDDPPAKALRINRSEIGARAASEQRKLRRMVDFAYADQCLRAFILRYFQDRKPLEACGTCSSCSPAPRPARERRKAAAMRAVDRMILDAVPMGENLREHLRQTKAERKDQSAREIALGRKQLPETATRALGEHQTIVARKVLSCVARLNGRFGKSIVAGVLRGSRSKKVLEPGLDALSTYGLLREMTVDEIGAWCDALIAAGHIDVSRGAYPTLSLTPSGRDAMRAVVPLSLELERFGLTRSGVPIEQRSGRR